jgi:hypothetical protein
MSAGVEAGPTGAFAAFALIGRRRRGRRGDGLFAPDGGAQARGHAGDDLVGQLARGFSCAVCSAAITAYSLDTTSRPSSTEAVASSAMAPVFRSTSW